MSPEFGGECEGVSQIILKAIGMDEGVEWEKSKV